jgi:predicted transcriptional regulator
MTSEIFNRAPDRTELTGALVAAYVSHNRVPVAELAKLIQSVHGTISGLASNSASETPASATEVEKPSAALIRKSVRDDGLTSFIDGKIYKTLKRHLTGHGFDPKSYRERYGLPVDYPMVARTYAAQRSTLAKTIGLGRHRAQ